MNSATLPADDGHGNEKPAEIRWEAQMEHGNKKQNAIKDEKMIAEQEVLKIQDFVNKMGGVERAKLALDELCVCENRHEPFFVLCMPKPHRETGEALAFSAPGICYRNRSKASNGVRTEPRFVLGSVQFAEPGVEFRLLAGIKVF